MSFWSIRSAFFSRKNFFHDMTNPDIQTVHGVSHPVVTPVNFHEDGLDSEDGPELTEENSTQLYRDETAHRLAKIVEQATQSQYKPA